MPNLDSHAILLTELLREKRRGRRWGIFFKLAVLAIILIVIGWSLAREVIQTATPHVAMVRVDGVLSAGGDVNAREVVQGLRDAFDSASATGVLLRINSPGGSPSEAGAVFDEIRRLRALHPQKPLYAVITESGTSAAYYVAAAADRIYANRASVVGSIGVIIEGFGFTGAMEKLGVERRLVMSGQSKNFLDPFSPLRARDVQNARALVDDIHQQFVNAVRRGRAGKLKEEEKLFTGLVWSGERALELGLVDGLADPWLVVGKHFETDAMLDYTPEREWDWLTGAAAAGAALFKRGVGWQ